MLSLELCRVTVTCFEPCYKVFNVSKSFSKVGRCIVFVTQSFKIISMVDQVAKLYFRCLTTNIKLTLNREKRNNDNTKDSFFFLLRKLPVHLLSKSKLQLTLAFKAV